MVDRAPSERYIPASMLVAENGKSKSTVANILVAAEALFLNRTYADVTVDQVAEAASVTKGAVYHHFSSKEQLYFAMLREDLAEKKKLHRHAMDQCGTARSRLYELTRAFLSLPPQKRDLITLVRRDINVFAEPLRSDLVQIYQESLPNLVEEIIRDGVRDSELVPCDPRLMAWHFVALVEVILTPYANQRFACVEDKLNHVCSLFWSGCARDSGEMQ